MACKPSLFSKKEYILIHRSQRSSSRQLRQWLQGAAAKGTHVPWHGLLLCVGSHVLSASALQTHPPSCGTVCQGSAVTPPEGVRCPIQTLDQIAVIQTLDQIAVMPFQALSEKLSHQ